MNKYKLTFKAEDKTRDDEDTFFRLSPLVREWMKEHGWEEYSAGKPDTDIYSYTYVKGTNRKAFNIGFYTEKIGIRIYTDNSKPDSVYKVDFYVKALPFSKEELKFFDSMDYETSPAHERHTGQSITDWFGKE